MSFLITNTSVSVHGSIEEFFRSTDVMNGSMVRSRSQTFIFLSPTISLYSLMTSSTVFVAIASVSGTILDSCFWGKTFLLLLLLLLVSLTMALLSQYFFDGRGGDLLERDSFVICASWSTSVIGLFFRVPDSLYRF